jgi:hypothetical protein
LFVAKGNVAEPWFYPSLLVGFYSVLDLNMFLPLHPSREKTSDKHAMANATEFTASARCINMIGRWLQPSGKLGYSWRSW